MTWRAVFENPVEVVDKSEHPTVIEYAVQEMFKKKSPRAAARATAKKLAGSENLFLGGGVVEIDATRLEQALWQRLADHTLQMRQHYREGIPLLYIAEGTAQHFKQKPGIAAEIVRRIEGV